MAKFILSLGVKGRPAGDDSGGPQGSAVSRLLAGGAGGVVDDLEPVVELDGDGVGYLVAVGDEFVAVAHGAGGGEVDDGGVEVELGDVYCITTTLRAGR